MIPRADRDLPIHPGARSGTVGLVLGCVAVTPTGACPRPEMPESRRAAEGAPQEARVPAGDGPMIDLRSVQLVASGGSSTSCSR